MTRRYKSPVFNPRSKKPFSISRTKLELFLRCARRFYLNQRLGIKFKDESYYSLNHAIDRLIKEGADRLRLAEEFNPLAAKYGVRAIPFDDPDIKKWLNPFEGLRFHHQPTNLVLFGAPDDVWMILRDTKTSIDYTELAVIDAKATSSKKQSVEESDFWESYKRQVEFYGWLLEKQDPPFAVSKTSYFIYANTRPGQAYDNASNLSLDFELKLIPHLGNTDWIEPVVVAIKECLMSGSLPQANNNCWICKYRARAAKIETKIRP